MATILQSTTDLNLRPEPKLMSPASGAAINAADQLELLGDPVPEQLGALQLTWLKVTCAKGEGFIDKKLTQEFVTPTPGSGPDMPIHLRRDLELPALATLCYTNALRSGTNSAILLALAFAETGSQWTDTLAQAADSPSGRIGIYGFTQAEWDAALFGVGLELDIKSDHIRRVRAQCEVAGVVIGRAWRTVEAARDGEVRGIDLYIAFLSNPDVAVKIAKADAASALSTVLTAAEAEALTARTSAVLAGTTVTPATTVSDAIAALAAKFETALAFVRSFADGLVADNVPDPEGTLETTEDELAHEDPTDGADDAVGPGSGISLDDIADPPDQPDDGTLLISEAHLVALWKRSLFPIDGRGIVLFGLRGCLPADPSTSMNFAATHKVELTAVNYRRMRCTIGQWRPGKGFALFPGSTVPFTDLVQTAAANGGADVNQMGRGRHRNYVPHWHKRREGRRRGHWALVQESDVSFQRTAGDVNYTPSDPWDTGRPGDNIHCAFHVGLDSKPAEAVYSSAGCQVVAGTVERGRSNSETGPWKKFIAPFKGASAQSGAEYVLFDGTELREVVQSKFAGKTVILRLGSEGDLVSDLQRKLGLSNPDRKFGKNTFRAVLKFQHANFGKSSDDGIVGVETAGKLGLDLPAFDFKAAIANVAVSSAQEVRTSAGSGDTGIETTLGSHTDPKFALLLELVSREESHGNYNAFFGRITNQDDPRFTSMTIRQVRRWQDDFVNAGSRSSAAGRYQIIRSTMDAIIGRLGLDGGETFDASLQDRMAIDLLGQRKLGKFLSGRIGITAFGNQLAMEWASLPVLSNIRGDKRNVRRGESYYAGDGINNAHIEPAVVEAALRRLIS